MFRDIVCAKLRGKFRMKFQKDMFSVREKLKFRHYIYQISQWDVTETDTISADRGEKMFLENERAASRCGIYSEN
jgi:hypothetical protein